MECLLLRKKFTPSLKSIHPSLADKSCMTLSSLSFDLTKIRAYKQTSRLVVLARSNTAAKASVVTTKLQLTATRLLVVHQLVSGHTPAVEVSAIPADTQLLTATVVFRTSAACYNTAAECKTAVVWEGPMAVLEFAVWEPTEWPVMDVGVGGWQTTTFMLRYFTYSRKNHIVNVHNGIIVLCNACLHWTRISSAGARLPNEGRGVALNRL